MANGSRVVLAAFVCTLLGAALLAVHTTVRISRMTLQDPRSALLGARGFQFPSGEKGGRGERREGGGRGVAQGLLRCLSPGDSWRLWLGSGYFALGGARRQPNCARHPKPTIVDGGLACQRGWHHDGSSLCCPGRISEEGISVVLYDLHGRSAGVSWAAPPLPGELKLIG